MKKIKILLSSVLTLLLFTGNNAYAAPHYTDFGGKFQDKKPNMHSGGRFMPKRNRLGDDISGYGYKNILKKGNVSRGNVRVLPNRGSYTDSGRITYRPGKNGFIGQTGKAGFLNEATLYQNGKDSFIGENGKDSFIGETGKAGFIGQARIGQTDENCIVGGTMCSARKSGAKTQIKFGGQEGEAFNPTSKYSISDEPAFIPKPDGSLGPDVVTTLEHGPGLRDSYDTDHGGGAHGVQQPKGVPLQFIDGEWVENQSLKPYAWP
ncbi:MAG: hypothetical protein NZ702_04215 [Gammaproteobacteria bacterium]|nr:hypothetical protein [Gammaproteobacteria bacterium]